MAVQCADVLDLAVDDGDGVLDLNIDVMDEATDKEVENEEKMLALKKQQAQLGESTRSLLKKFLNTRK